MQSDTLASIFSYLPTWQYMSRMAQVCPLWKQVAADHRMYTTMVIRDQKRRMVRSWLTRIHTEAWYIRKLNIQWNASLGLLDQTVRALSHTLEELRGFRFNVSTLFKAPHLHTVEFHLLEYDVDAVPFGEDVFLHPRVPALNLVPEVHARFEQVFHCYDCQEFLP